MKKLYRQCTLSLKLAMGIVLAGQMPIVAKPPLPSPPPIFSNTTQLSNQSSGWVCSPEERETKIVQLYFIREAETAKTILEAIQKGNTALT